MKLRFIKERDGDNTHDNTIVNMETVADYLPDILENFECFLRACGFQFSGSLQIINETESNNED